MKHILAVCVAGVAFGVVTASSHTFPPETRSFAYMHDNKPVGGETFTRSADSISGEIALGTSRVHYEGRIAADGTIPRLDIQTSRSGGAANTQGFISMIVGRDSVLLIERVGRKVDSLRLASRPGTIPIFDPSIGLYEVIVARARALKARAKTVPMSVVKIDADDLGKFPTRSLRSIAAFVPGEVTFLPADTVMLGNTQEKDKVRLIIGADGRARAAASGADAKDHFSMRPTSKPAPLKR